MADDFGNIIRERVDQDEALVHNKSIYIENYFQDPDFADPDDSPYQGHIDKMTVADFIKEVLEEGTKKAGKVAAKTLHEVKQAMKINYF